MDRIRGKFQNLFSSSENAATKNSLEDNNVHSIDMKDNFSPLNIHEVIKPLYYASKPVCLWPYDYRPETQTITNLGLTNKLFGYLFALALAIYFICLSGRPLLKNLQEICTALAITDLMTILFGHILSIFSILSLNTFTGKLGWKFFWEAEQIGRLEPFADVLERCHFKRKLLLNVSSTVATALLIYSFDFGIYVKAIGLEATFVFANYYVIQYQMALIMLQIYWKAEILLQYFRRVNERLKECVSSNHRCANGSCQQSLKGCNVSKVAWLGHAHGRLCNLMKLSNKAHGWQTVMLVVTVIVSMLHYLYFGTTAATMHVNIKGYTEDLLRIWQVSSILFYGVLVVLLAAKCSSASHQAHKTGFLASDALVQLETVVTDQNPKHMELYREQLQQLVNQVSFRNPHFSAAGLFQLDFSTVTTIIGAVTSYYIVFLQFREAPNCNSAAHHVNSTKH